MYFGARKTANSLFSFPPFFYVPFFCHHVCQCFHGCSRVLFASRRRRRRRTKDWDRKNGDLVFGNRGSGSSETGEERMAAASILYAKAASLRRSPPPLLIIPPFKWGTGRAGPSQSPQTFGSAKKEIFLLKNSNRFPRRRRCGEATAASPASSSVASWPPTRTVTGGASS